MNHKTISILGCGWLGLPLGEQLQKQGWQVKGATTSSEKLPLLAKKGIRPYLVRFDPEINDDGDQSFFEADTLLINIPPGRRRPDVLSWYTQQMSAVAEAAQGKVTHILFISSTSIYSDLNRVVKEDDAGELPEKDSGKAVGQAEQIFMQNTSFNTTIVRFCGLYGPERNPGRFLAGRTLKTSGDEGVNLIHLDDCLNILKRILEKNVWGEVFNACADRHPAKNKYYPAVAKANGLEPPVFTGESEESYKTISNEKLKKALDYKFIHPDPMDDI